jgi:hypothetical protein
MAKKDVKEKAAAKEDIQEAKPEVKEQPKAAHGPVWVKVTAQELVKLQAEAKLIGYRPDTGEALIR